MRALRALSIVIAVTALTSAGVVGAASAAEVPIESDGGSIVADYAYPGAAAILEAQHVQLIAGDGHIVLADCATPAVNEVGVLKVWTTERLGPGGAGLVCFKVTAPVGWLTLSVPGVFEIRGDGQVTGSGNHVTATVTADGDGPTTVNVDPSGSTQVGIGIDSDNAPTTLVQLRVNDQPPSGGTGQYPFVARIDVNGRGCSGVLVQAQYVATSKTCFAADGNVTAGPAPASATAVVGRPDPAYSGGVQAAIVELIPRADRNLVLAKLASPVTGIGPVSLAATPGAGGDIVTGAGYGHTAGDWSVGTLHTGSFTVTGVTTTTLQLARAAGTATSTCAGDAGGPTIRTGVDGRPELLAIHDTSWQTGCFGVTETRDLASETRVDDIAGWMRENAPPPNAVRTGLAATTWVGAADINHDGRVDLLARDGSGVLWLYANTGGSGLSTFAAPTQSSYGQFADKTWIGLGDVDGDGYPDVLSRDSAGNLVVQVNIGGTGPGTFAAVGRALGDYLNGMDLAAVGDVDGNGRADVIARRSSDGTMWYFENYLDGAGNAQLLHGVQIGHGTDAFTALSLADYTGDGHADLLALEVDGNLYFYPWIYGGLPPGFGGYGTLVVGSGQSAAAMLAGAELTGDNLPDLLKVDTAGTASVYPNTGTAGTPAFDAAP